MALSALVLGCLALESRPALAETGKVKNVLLLFSHERERDIYARLEDGLRSTLLSNTASAVNTFTEYLDLFRFTGEDQQLRMANYLGVKYVDFPLSLIITISPPALDFALHYRDRAFAGVPIVVTSVSVGKAASLRGLEGVTGVAVKHDAVSTLDLALRLHPDAVSVVIPAGTSSIERAWTEDARTLLRPYEGRVHITFLTDLSMNDIEQRLQTLPRHTIVLSAGLLYYDATGQYFLPEEALRRICLSSSAPVYGTNEPEMGSGIVGGSLYDLGVVGTAAGVVGQRVLAGEPTASIPIQTLEVDRNTFDARQLQRWKIDERLLPAGSTVRFRPPSMWRDYRPQVLLVAAATLAQMLLIVGLLLEYRRRRAAELQTRRDLATMAQLERRGALGQLTGSIAHELFQPLGAILRNAEAGKIMAASNPPAKLDEIQEVFEDIRQDDKRAGAIIQRIRALLTKHELEEQRVDVNDVTRETIALIGPDAESWGVRVNANLAARPSIVMGDRIHLQQVVLNLMLNGIDAMKAVSNERRLLFVRTQSTAGRVEVAIEDRGDGIPFEPVSKVFEPFFTTKADGMGMGLSIARNIVEAHGGMLVAENNRDVGATFRFSIPRDAG